MSQIPKPAAKTPITNPNGLREVERPIASVVIISADQKFLLGQKHPHGASSVVVT